MSGGKPSFLVEGDGGQNFTVDDASIAANLAKVWERAVKSVTYSKGSNSYEATLAPGGCSIEQKNVQTGKVRRVLPGLGFTPGFEFMDEKGRWRPITSPKICEGLADVYTEQKALFAYEVGSNKYEATLASPACMLAQRNTATSVVRAVRASPFVGAFEYFEDVAGTWKQIDDPFINQQIAAVMAGQGARTYQVGPSSMECRDGGDGGAIQRNTSSGVERRVRRSLFARPRFEFLLDPNGSVKWAVISNEDAVAALNSAFEGKGAAKYTSKNHQGGAFTYTAKLHQSGAYLIQKNESTGKERNVRPQAWSLHAPPTAVRGPPGLMKQPSWIDSVGMAVGGAIDDLSNQLNQLGAAAPPPAAAVPVAQGVDDVDDGNAVIPMGLPVA